MISNKEVICEVLCEHASGDGSIFVLCSDSRGSGSMTKFFDTFPEQSVEIGIAEQALVGVAAGMASCGIKAFAVSPSSFLSARAVEQIKVDVAYSGTNVKLIGISGGVSYGALGQSHHSVQDIAMTSAIPNLRVYLPSDRFLTRALVERLLREEQPAFIRVGRGAAEDIYREGFSLAAGARSVTVCEGTDICILAAGELVAEAKKAAERLKEDGISCGVKDMFSIKPLDEAAVLSAADTAGGIITLEEHSIIGGLGAAVCQHLLQNGRSVPVKCLAFPDELLIGGKQREVWEHYGLCCDGVRESARQLARHL